jgi:hypothetical protein
MVDARLLTAAASASAQYFDRNRVQSDRFECSVFATTHFDIYCYDADEAVARLVVPLAARWYDPPRPSVRAGGRTSSSTHARPFRPRRRSPGAFAMTGEFADHAAGRVVLPIRRIGGPTGLRFAPAWARMPDAVAVRVLSLLLPREAGMAVAVPRAGTHRIRGQAPRQSPQRITKQHARVPAADWCASAEPFICQGRALFAWGIHGADRISLFARAISSERTAAAGVPRPSRRIPCGDVLGSLLSVE